MAPAPPAKDSDIRTASFESLKLAAALLATWAGAGCYQYRTSGPDAVQPGQVVHVDLTAPGAATLASTIGPNATALNGRVLTRAGNDVTLAVTQIDRGAAPEQFLKGDPISFSLANVSAVQLRSFDKQRTALAIGGIVGAILVGQIFIDQSGIFSNRTVTSGNTK
jgi:hypothetical protein